VLNADEAIDACHGGPPIEHYRKPARRDEFLATMEAIVPWSALCEVIEPPLSQSRQL